MKKYYFVMLFFTVISIQPLLAQLSATVHFTNPTCLASGSAYVVASGGSNYTYKWSTGATTDSVFRLIADTYTVTVYSTGGITTWDSVYLETFDSTVQTWATNISTGANGTTNNYWDISDSCVGNGAIGACVDNTYSPPVGSNKCLYITAKPNNLTLPQYAGARYDAGGPDYCSLLSLCTNTNLAAQSPDIFTSGVHNLVLSFQYTGGGVGLSDVASLLYSTNGGTSFTVLADSLRSVNNANCMADGDMEGNWAYASFALPSSCNNISDLVIRFNWTNDGNGDAGATDPSIAVDNVTLRDSIPGSGIDSVVKTFTLTNPVPPQISNASMVVTNSSCGHNNGSITGLSVTGGQSPYAIEWINSSNMVIDSTYPLTGVDSGEYTFKVIDANGCTTDTTIDIATTQGSVKPVISTANDTVCSGDLVSMCSNPQNYLHYLWSTGDTTGCIIGGPGTYSLTVTDSAGCVTASNAFVLDSFPPLSPVIVVSGVTGDTIVATGGGNSYQWYANGQPVLGANDSIYIINGPGSYTVEVSGSNSCNYFSAPHTYGELGVENVTSSELIDMYPNPLVSAPLFLQLDAKLLNATCIIFDAGSRVVFKTEINNADTKLYLDVSSGIYTVQVISALGTYTLRLIKL